VLTGPPHLSVAAARLCVQAVIKVVFLAAVIGVVGSKAPTAFHGFNKAGQAHTHAEPVVL
jgi:hypothetical protein